MATILTKGFLGPLAAGPLLGIEAVKLTARIGRKRTLPPIEPMSLDSPSTNENKISWDFKPKPTKTLKIHITSEDMAVNGVSRDFKTIPTKPPVDSGSIDDKSSDGISWNFEPKQALSLNRDDESEGKIWKGGDADIYSR